MDAASSAPTRIEVISLEVSGHAFCIDIGAVREIRGWTKSTPLPQAPDYVQGVINLRGTVMPVMDLGARLGFGKTEASSRNVVIVVDHDGGLLGLLVDAVQETVTLETSEFQTPPRLPGSHNAFLDALIPQEDGILGRLNLDALVPKAAMAA